MALYTGGGLSLARPEMICRACEPEIDHMVVMTLSWKSLVQTRRYSF